jgi:hypothetical protein
MQSLRSHLVTPHANVHYGNNTANVWAGEGTMDELIGRLVANGGID